MFWFALYHAFSCFVELFTVHCLTDAQKDIQILLLRQQVRVLQRKAREPKRFSRLEKARTTDMQKKAIEFERVMAAFSQLLDLWQPTDSDGRSVLARGLFQYLVVDLDKQQIVDFRLHPWADQYLIVRADLYGDDYDTGLAHSLDNEDEGENSGNSGVNGSFEANKNRFTDYLSDEAIDDPNGLPHVS